MAPTRFGYCVAFLLTTLLLVIAQGRADALAQERNSRSATATVDVGHAWRIWSVAYSPDGRHVASGGDDGAVKVWDVASGRLLRTLQVARNETSSVTVAFAPTGHRIVAAAGTTLVLWDFEAGRIVKTFDKASAALSSVAVSRDGRRVVTGDDAGKLVIWAPATGKPERTFGSHTEAVNAVAISADGRIVMSGGKDKVIKIWDADSGREVASLDGHQESIHTVALSADGTLAASGSWDDTVKLWDLGSKALARTLEIGDDVMSVAFSPDGTGLLVASSAITLWQVASGDRIATFGSSAVPKFSVAFSPDGGRAVSGGYDFELTLWDLTARQLVWSTAPGAEEISTVVYSPDGTQLASIAGGLLPSDHTIKLWSAKDGKLIRELEGHTDAVNAVVFSSDGKQFISASSSPPITVWSVANGKVLRTIDDFADAVTALAVVPGSSRIVAGSADGAVKVLDISKGAVVRSFEGHTGRIASVAVARDGRHMASAGADKTVRIWDLGTGQQIASFDGTAEIHAIAFSPDGRFLAAGGEEEPLKGTLKLWSVETRTLVFEMKQAWIVHTLAFTPDGQTILTGEADKNVQVRQAASGRAVNTFSGHSAEVKSVAVAPDGMAFASAGGDNTIKLWRTASAPKLKTLGMNRSSFYQLASSPDGRWIASPDGTAASIWDMSTGAVARTLKGAVHSQTVSAIAFSPDGSLVLTASEDATLKLWDFRSGNFLRSLVGHSDRVTATVFSKDGARIVSASADKSLKLWNVATGSLERTFEGHQDNITSVAISNDGSRIMSTGPDRQLKLWSTTTGQALQSRSALASEQSLSFMADARQFLSAVDAVVHLTETDTGKVIRSFREHTDIVNSFVLSTDGTQLLTGSWDGTAKIWDFASGKVLRTFAGHLGRVYQVAFLSDGRIATSGGDTTIRIWNAQSGEQLSMLIAGRDDANAWQSMATSGFFTGPATGQDVLHVVRGLDVTTIAQVHQSLYNPDLVREALAGDPKGEVAEAAKVINLETVLDSGPAPVVAMSAPAATTETDLVTFSAKINDRGKGIGRIEWRVNGVTAAVAERPAGAGPDYTLTQALALDPGPNTIELVAYNGANLLASLPARAQITFTGPADKAKPKLHILAVGINDYVDTGWTSPGKVEPERFEPLKLAVKDAETFAADLKRAAAPLFVDVEITPVMNATRDNLEKAVEKLADTVHPRDTFVLFVAGHGKSVDGRFYIIPQDYQGGTDPGALRAKGIGQDRLQHWLANRIKAKKALILLDTCESGALVAGHARARTEGSMSEAAIGRLHEATGRPVLTAAAIGAPAYEDDKDTLKVKHGLFTWALLEGLRKADTDKDGNIRLSALVAHVQDRVPKLAAALGGQGSTKSATGGAVAAVAPTPTQKKPEQAARFGSHGEDFVLARRLP